MADNYERYKTENLEQKEAFEYYYSLGQGRTIPQVAKKFGKSSRTVYEWSRKFNWQERIEQRDIEIGRRLEEKTIDTVVNEKARYRKIIKLAIAEFVKNLQAGKVKADSIVDLERLIKLDLTLMGEPTEINQNNNNHGLTEEDREALNNYAKAIIARVNDVDLE